MSYHIFIKTILSNHTMHFSGIYCDIRKGFGCVDYALLLTKLKYYGIKN
jgi:hypothetical protein